MLTRFAPAANAYPVCSCSKCLPCFSLQQMFTLFSPAANVYPVCPCSKCLSCFPLQQMFTLFFPAANVYPVCPCSNCLPCLPLEQMFTLFAPAANVYPVCPWSKCLPCLPLRPLWTRGRRGDRLEREAERGPWGACPRPLPALPPLPPPLHPGQLRLPVWNRFWFEIRQIFLYTAPEDGTNIWNWPPEGCSQRRRVCFRLTGLQESRNLFF